MGAHARVNIALLKIVKKNIRVWWGSEWDRTLTFKTKDKIGTWVSSFHVNRWREVVLARLRVNSIKGIHLIPRIERTYPIDCDCGINLANC